jgi:hypothetical protein
MIGVSLWRAFRSTVLFTFSAAVCGSGIIGCVTGTTRVLMHSPNAAPRATSASTNAKVDQPAAASVPLSAGETPINRLTPNRVPDIHVDVPWRVDFGTDCVVSAQAPAGGAFWVEISGDFEVSGYELRVKLDAALSRVVAAKQKERTLIPSTQLVDPWTDIGTGTHRLAVFATRVGDGQVPLDTDGAAAVSFCEFSSETGARISQADVQLDNALLGPEGTLHGEGAGGLLVQLFSRGHRLPSLSPAPRSGAKVRLLVERPDGGYDTHTVEPGVYRLVPATGASPLAAGDYSVRTEPHSSTVPEKAENMLSALTYTVAVNPE